MACVPTFFRMATADKYDRQLRLWGANGQRKLMTSHILLINATAVGTETLKNLVLPGLGSFTILDSSPIQSNDLGNNFFTPSGLYRGQSAVDHLCEMNPDVKGSFLNSDLQTELSQGHSPHLIV
jgi:NEDD8-activating enzyme E1 regulatory subunit